MDVKKFTEAAMLCASFVILSVLSISLGFSYFGYIDFVVPILIAIIYLKCGFKYSILSSISSFILIIFVVGDVASGIMMIQSMILGIVLAVVLNKSKGNIFDDLVIISIFSCFVMIIMDINFSTLTGYSLLKETEQIIREMPDYFSTLLSNRVIEENSSYNLFINNMYTTLSLYGDVIYYMNISILPVGTTILCYLGTLLLGKKFKIFNKNINKKWYIIRNYKKYLSLICISTKIIITSICYLLLFTILNKLTIFNNFIYLKIILHCINYILLFFILQDSISMFNKFVYSYSKSRTNTFICQILIFISLLNFFKITSIFLVISNLFIDFKFKIKKYNNEIINSLVIN